MTDSDANPGDNLLGELASRLGDILGLATVLTPAQQDALVPFGGYQLQWGDNDNLSPPVYEGIGRVPPANLPDPGADGYVTVLQKQLALLGFDPQLVPDGIFGRTDSWLVREFQIYASMDNVATEDPNAKGTYADRLTATPNAQKYDGDITGRLDGATAVALQYWVSNGYRCPVVAESRDKNFGLINDNIWFSPEDTQPGHMCWVTDLTGTYAVDPQRLQAQGGGADPSHRRILAGYFTTSAYGNGPVCQPPTVWSDDTIPQSTTITVQTLTGDTAAASPQTISTYKVIRAVVHVEPGDYFDGINSYDAARVSLGPYHFAFYVQNSTGVNSSTELPALLSFLATWLPDDFQAAFGRYGVAIDQAWPNDAPPADATAPDNQLLRSGQCKWTTYLRQSGLQGTTASIATTASDPPYIPISMSPTRVMLPGDADYFRSWHWFYRWVMACRMFPTFWPECWYLCRYRLQAVLDAPFPASSGLPGGTTLGQVYTSEYAVTALLRAHVNKPGYVVGGGIASTTILSAYYNAKANDPSLTDDPDTWTDAQRRNVDAEMVSALIARDTQPDGTQGPIASTMMLALEYISDAGSAVDPTPGSFSFDAQW
jgi:hypothetical protein